LKGPKKAYILKFRHIELTSGGDVHFKRTQTSLPKDTTKKLNGDEDFTLAFGYKYFETFFWTSKHRKTLGVNNNPLAVGSEECVLP